MVVELIFAMILTLELVPADTGSYSVDVLENTEVTMQVTAERDNEVARFVDGEGQVLLTTERSLTTAHVYTAFPADGPPRVFDAGEALDALGPFRTEPVQTISAAPDAESPAIDWTIADRNGLFYLGIPSTETVLVIRTEAGS